VADADGAGVLRDRIDGGGGKPVRYFEVWVGGDAVFSPAIGRDDRRRDGDLQDGIGRQTHLRPDGRTEMGDCNGGVRVDGRDVSELRGASRSGPNYSGGCVCGGLSATAGGAAGCTLAVAGEGGEGAGSGKFNDCCTFQEGRVIELPNVFPRSSEQVAGAIRRNTF